MQGRAVPGREGNKRWILVPDRHPWVGVWYGWLGSVGLGWAGVWYGWLGSVGLGWVGVWYGWIPDAHALFSSYFSSTIVAETGFTRSLDEPIRSCSAWNILRSEFFIVTYTEEHQQVQFVLDGQLFTNDTHVHVNLLLILIQLHERCGAIEQPKANGLVRMDGDHIGITSRSRGLESLWSLRGERGEGPASPGPPACLCLCAGACE